MTSWFIVLVVAAWIGMGLRIGWYAGGAFEDLMEGLTARLRCWAAGKNPSKENAA